ncbi:hypothetical protein GCM10014719_57780 [Planomonospora parontospora subsp. antibiotica]|nr:hypothetical protein GCM10014719_57780 [Planomonospora parontospora subsp. antibiotica]GII18917.1 hypothetical protein Ppa05_56430 [Planomonospora parontospora subsp. antibiotica]
MSCRQSATRAPRVSGRDRGVLLRGCLTGAPSLLDLGTGGGEFLSGLAPLPPRTAATEGYPLVSWQVPDFDVDRYAPRLHVLHEDMAHGRPLTAYAHRFALLAAPRGSGRRRSPHRSPLTADGVLRSNP